MTYRPLPQHLQGIATNELNEDATRVEEDISHIRDWLKKQPHLTARQDDHFLLCFLRGCKFSLQRAKEKLDNFYTLRGMIPEYFVSRNPFAADIQPILKAGFALPLSRPDDPSGPRVILVQWGAVDPSTMPFQLLMKTLYMIIDVLVEEDANTIVSGIHFTPDFKNFPIGYIMQFTPTATQKSFAGIQSAYPLRIKGLDFINVPGVFDTVFAIIKPFLTEKLRQRTHVYTESKISNLFQRIPQSIFPKEYGGSGETLQELTDMWKSKIESYSQWFNDDQKYHCDENLRPGGIKNHIFGAEGTFRKINLD